MIDNQGWLLGCKRLASPNFDSRPDGVEVSLLVVHNISLPPDEYGGGHIEAFFCNDLEVSAHPYFSSIAGLKVSSHVLIDRAGQVTQFVSFLDRAWHAGISRFGEHEKCNDFSIGIELEGTDIDPYTDQQYRQLAILTEHLCARFPAITPERIVGHCDIAPGRKTDPGLSFDWYRFLHSLGRDS
jgi:N-acetyl-anhydromuramoyl-L-alanine amidase